MPAQRFLNVGLIGAGRIGSGHAQLIDGAVPNARLVAVADPAGDAAARLSEALGTPAAYTDAAQLLAAPDVEAVVITASACSHTGLAEQAAAAGKSVFCERPAAMTMGEIDRVQEAVDGRGIVFRVGFNRRFADGFPQARAVIDAGRIGTPQLLRSVTRDPGLADPAAVAPWTIFLGTLIHDFDTLNFLNPAARAVRVYAVADALVAPEFKESGLLDTAVVTVRYDNGAIATAEASFSAAYGCDNRAEAFGPGGMVTAGRLDASSARYYGPEGLAADTVRRGAGSVRAACTAELQAFVDTALGSPVGGPGTEAARDALRIALACIESHRTGAPVDL